MGTIGLDDLLERGNLPKRGLLIGHKIGPLTSRAAKDLGLDQKCLVGPGLVDAYAGVLGSVGSFAGEAESIESHFALVGGTSSCVVAISREKRPGNGLWGPYFDVLLPGHWLVEGGQSASGALLDYVVRMHAAGGDPVSARHQAIIERIAILRDVEGDQFASGLHVLPDFHGNRSPFGNPFAGGVISGLSLDMSVDGLCKLYFRTAVGIAFGMRQILKQLHENGYRGSSLHVAGGHTHNSLLMELYGDICGYDIIAPPEKTDVVLLGNAMAASVTGGIHSDLQTAASNMAFEASVRPFDKRRNTSFGRDYATFKIMQRHRAEIGSA